VIRTPTRVLRDLRSPLMRNAAYLSVNEGIGAVFGLVFWVLAARLLSAGEVGIGTAIIGVGVLLSAIAQFGFPTALIRYAPAAGPRTAAFVDTALLLGLGLSLAVSGVFLAGAALWAPGLAASLATPAQGVLFLGFVAGWTVFVILDAALIGIGAAKRVLQRGAVTNVLKLGLLVPFVLLAGTGLSIPASFGLALWCGTAIGILVVVRTNAFGRMRWRIDRGAAREMARFAAGNQTAVLLASCVALLLPVITLHAIGPEAAAFFYVAWQISNLLNLLPASVQLSVLAEASRDERRMEEHTRTGLLWTYAVLAPAALVGILLAPFLLSAFHESYATAAVLLQLLLVNGLVQAFNGAYTTRLRVERRLAPLIALNAGFVAAAIGGSYALMPRFGLTGVGVAILAAQVGFAGFAVVGLWDYRRQARDETTPPRPT